MRTCLTTPVTDGAEVAEVLVATAVVAAAEVVGAALEDVGTTEVGAATVLLITWAGELVAAAEDVECV